MAKETFFLIQVPTGTTPRQWGKSHSEAYGFDYDNQSREARVLLAWPHMTTPSQLARNLRGSRIRFSMVEADPKKLFKIP